MHRRLMFIFVLVAAVITACQGPPPTQIIMVVTATPTDTPDPAEATAEVTAEVEETADMQLTATPTPGETATPEPTATVDPFPTATVNQIQVAEQVFENGRMFWVQPTGQIWVMIITGEGEGEWQIYEDTFVEGEMEEDPEIVPPEGFEEPQRGFGKLWRETPDLRETLGWAVTPEFGYVTRYEYHPGGTLDDDGEWVRGPGHHVLTSLYEEAFRFNEADQTWELN